MVGGSLTREEIQDILTIANEVAEHTRAGMVCPYPRGGVGQCLYPRGGIGAQYTYML